MLNGDELVAVQSGGTAEVQGRRRWSCSVIIQHGILLRRSRRGTHEAAAVTGAVAGMRYTGSGAVAIPAAVDQVLLDLEPLLNLTPVNLVLAGRRSLVSSAVDIVSVRMKDFELERGREYPPGTHPRDSFLQVTWLLVMMLLLLLGDHLDDYAAAHI